MTQPDQNLNATPNVELFDEISSAVGMLTGVSDALSYRAACENDNMLMMLSMVIDDQIERLSNLPVSPSL